MLAENQLKYVQVESNTALIDSRVYCRDIIEVHHGDWIQNVVKKHKSSVEAKFGTLRFQNGAVLSHDGVANNTEKYVLLTEAQCNAFLSLSRNSEKIIEKKLDLIADFERAKARIRESLERALLGETNPELEALKQENAQLRQTIGATISDRLEFPYSSKQLQRDSRIVNHSHVVASIKRDFVKDKDYQEVEGQIFITEQLYTCFMLTFRSEKGADISVLPSILTIATKFFFQFQQARSKKNSRTAQSDSQHEQLSLL
jgi:hypothetical protein